jgi:RecA/RadA recombinase
VGGVPRGRVIEIYGPESSGKTTLCQHIIAEAQKRGGICAFIDMEHALDPTYAARCGVDIDNLYVSQPDTGEQALEIAEALIRSGTMDVVVIDSVAALVPRAEIEGEMGDAHVGLQARLMSQALRKLSGVIKQTNTVVIFTNQLREKIGVMFGNPETTSGGNALKFYASVRLDIRRIQAIKAGNDVIGNRTRVKVKKNKVAPPFTEASSTSCTTRASPAPATCWTWPRLRNRRQARRLFPLWRDPPGPGPRKRQDEERTAEPVAPTSLGDLQRKTKVTGTVTRLELYGAFIDIGLDVNAILHISQLDQKVNRISDVLNVGDEVSVWIDKVDPDRQQVTVTMVEPLAVDWNDLKVGQQYTGEVTRLEKFGAFINIGAEKEGLVHVSELSYDYIKHPSEAVRVGDRIEVQVLGFSKRKRRIDLSRKVLLEAPESEQVAPQDLAYEEEEDATLPTAMEIALRRAMGDQAPSGSGKGGQKSKAQRKVTRNKQDDILSRTLRLSQEAAKEQ